MPEISTTKRLLVLQPKSIGPGLPDGHVGQADVEDGQDEKGRVEDAESSQEGGEEVPDPEKRNLKLTLESVAQELEPQRSQ